MKKYLIVCAALAAVLAGGCFSSTSTTVEKMGEAYRVVAHSLLLNNHIQVIERSTRRTNGLLEAQVRGQNMKGKDIQFEYRFIWLDADGMRLDTEMSTWKPLALSGKEVAFMTGIAPTPDATDFLMAVRFSQQSTRW